MTDTPPTAAPDAPPKPNPRAQTEALRIMAVCGFILIAGIIAARLYAPGADKAETFLATVTQGLLSIELTIATFYFGSSYIQQQAKP